MSLERRFGGNFAPPLDDLKLHECRSLAKDGATPAPIRDAMATLLVCVEKWRDLPESKPGRERPHPSGRGLIRPLDKAIQDELFDLIPWEHEIAAIQSLFDGIDNTTNRPLRNACFHLLWYVKELNNDREPITSDLIQAQ